MRTSQFNESYSKVQDSYVDFYSNHKWYSIPYDLNCSICSLFETMHIEDSVKNLLSLYFYSKAYCDVHIVDAAVMTICCCLTNENDLYTFIKKITPYDVCYHYFVFGCGMDKSNVTMTAVRTRRALNMMRELHIIKDKMDSSNSHPLICLSEYKRLTNFHESCTINVRRNIACCNHFISNRLSQLVSNQMQNFEISDRYILLGETKSRPSVSLNYDNSEFRINRLLGKDLQMLDPWGAKRHTCLICRTKQLPEMREKYLTFETKLINQIKEKFSSVPTAVEDLKSYWPINDRKKLIQHYDVADGDIVCSLNENKMFHVYDLVHDKDLLYKGAFLKNLFCDSLRERNAVLCPSVYLACYVQTALLFNDKSTAIHDFQWVYRLLRHHKVGI